MQLTSGIQVIETEFWGRPLYLALFVDEQVALVDTGLVGMGETDVIPCMRSLGKSSEDLSLIINTHAHADHIGGNRELWLASGKRARFAAHRADVPWIEDPPSQGPGLYQRYVDLGLIDPDALADALRAAGPGTKIDYALEGGERFGLGRNLELEIIPAPGHTLGNICVYERRGKVLVHGESVVGRGQFDTEGDLLSVPSYDDVEAYLKTIARLAQIDFDWFISSHVAPMKRDAAADYFSESLEFSLGFDAEVQRRLQGAARAMSTPDLLGSMEDLWGEYPADLGMAMLIDTHLRSLLDRCLIRGSLGDGVSWRGGEDTRFASLVKAARLTLRTPRLCGVSAARFRSRTVRGEMQYRERILAAVNGKEQYPVPVDVLSNLIHPDLESKLMQRTAVDDRESLQRVLGAHMRWANPKYIGSPLEKAPFQPPDPWPNEYAYKNIWGAYAGLNTYSDDVVERPLRDVDSVGEVKRYPWPYPECFDYGMVAPNVSVDSDDHVSMAQWAEESADFARVIGGYDPIFGRICDLCGFEAALLKTAILPKVMRALVEHITDFLEAYYRGIAEAGRGYVDILAFGDDFAGQNGMLISPKQWREYFKDSWARLFAVAHEHGMKAHFHSCGGIRPVLGDLIDAGMDIFEVVQIRAKDMDPAELKREFGADLTFYGTVDVQDVLPNYSPEGVRSEVRRLVDIFGPGGRYILTSSHLLLGDVPVENVIAMFDEARTYRP